MQWVGATLHCSARASHCGGFSPSRSSRVHGLSSCGSQALDTGSGIMVHGLSSSVACGLFLDRGSNLCLLDWQANSLPLSHQGGPSLIGFYDVFLSFLFFNVLWICSRVMVCGYYEFCIKRLINNMVFSLMLASYLHLPTWIPSFSSSHFMFLSSQIIPFYVVNLATKFI